MTSEPSSRVTRSRKKADRAIPSLMPARSRASNMRTCPPSRGSPPARDTTNTNTPSAKSMFPILTTPGDVATTVAQRFSERDAELELHHPRLVGEVAVVGRLAVARARFGERVRPVVRAVEDVEHVDDARERAMTNRDRLLHAHVDAMNRQSDEVVTPETGTWHQEERAKHQDTSDHTSTGHVSGSLSGSGIRGAGSAES